MNLNEQMSSTMAPQEPHKQFNYAEFKRMLKIVNVSGSDIKSYISRPDVLDCFRKPLHALFPRKEQNPSEAWTSSKITTFSLNQTPITQMMRDCISVIASDLNMSVIKVFEYLDQFIKNNSYILSVITQPNLFSAYQGLIEDSIASMFMNDRYFCLQGINFAIVEMNSDNYVKRQVLQDVIGPMLESNSLINVLIETYQHPDQLATAPYFRKNPQSLITAKQREEYLIMNIIFSMFVNQRVSRDIVKIYGKLFGVFMKQKFEGVTNELCEQLKISRESYYKFSTEITDKSSILILYILITGILQGLNFEPDRQKLNIHHLITLNKEIKDHLKMHSEESKTHKIRLFEMIYGMIIKAAMVGYGNKDDNYSILDNVLHTMEIGIDDEFPDYLMMLVEQVGKFDAPTSNSIREVLKMLLDILAFLDQRETGIMDTNFSNQTIKARVLLKIFKEAMKNADVLIKFWRHDLAKIKETPSFIREYIFAYPADRENFLTILNCLVGNKQYPFTDETLWTFAQMDSITVTIENSFDFTTGSLKKVAHQFNGDQVELSRQVTTVEGVELAAGTKLIRKMNTDNTYEAFLTFNFWQAIYHELSEFLSANRSYKRIILPDYIRKSIKLIAKILIINPEEAWTLQQLFFSNNGLIESEQGEGDHASILFFLLFDIYNLIYENSAFAKTTNFIIQAFKSLLTSHHQDSVAFFLKLSPLLSQYAENPQKNTLLNFYSCFEIAEQEGTNYKQNQRHYFHSLISIVQIFKILISDEEFWVNHLLASVDQPMSRGSQANQQNAETALRRIADAYTQMTQDQSNFSDYEEMNDAFCEVYKVREFISYSMLDELWNTLVIPLCRRYLINDIEANADNVSLKYVLYKSIFELVNCVLNKLSYRKSKYQLRVQDSKSDYKQLFNTKVHNYLASLPIMDMIKCAFNVTVHLSPYKMQVSSKKSSQVGISNVHWDELSEQQLLRKAGTEVLEFFTVTLETVTLIAKVCRQEDNFSLKKEESKLLRDFFADFCYRESIHKYIVPSANDTQSVNIFVALISLIILDYDRYANTVDERSQNIQKANSAFLTYDFTSSDLLFQSMSDQNTFALFVNKDLLYERAFDSSKILAKAYSVSEAGFSALNEILKFWSSQKNVKKPNFDDYVIGLYNDMPNSKILMDAFLFTLNNSISVGFSSAYDFLLQVQQSQPRFLEELFKLTDLSEKNGSNVLFTIVVKMLKTLSTLAVSASNPTGILNARENFFKLSLLILRLLQSNRISKTLVDEIWSMCFDLLSENVLRHLSESIDPFENSFNFIVETLSGERVRYNGQYCLSWSMNMQRLFYLTHLGKLQDKVLEELLNLVSSAFYQKFTKKKIHFFDSHAITFFKNFSQFSQKLFKGIISDNIFNGYSLATHLQEVRSGILSEVESKLFFSDISGFHRTTFYGQTKSIYDSKLSFISTAGATSTAQNINQENGKISFDSVGAFLIMRACGVNQIEANKIAYVCSFQNQVDLAMDSKSILQNRLIDFLSLIYSVGLKGTLANSSFNQLPDQNLSEYIANTSKKLQELKSNYLGMSFYLLSTQFMSLLSKSSTGFNDKLQLNTDINIQNNEKVFLNPIASKTGPLKLSLLNILVKENGQQIGESNGGEIMDWAFSRIELCKSLLDYFISNFIKSEINSTKYSNISFEILLKIIRFTNSHLELVAHLITNLGVQNAEYFVSTVESIKVLIGLLVQAVPMITHFYTTFSADIEFFLHCLLYSAFILKTNNSKMDPEAIAPIKDLTLQVLLKSKNLNLLALNIFDTVFSQNADQLEISDIDLLSERIAQKDIPPSEFNFIVTMLTNFAIVSENKTKIISSNLLNNILNIKVISSLPNFHRCVLYLNNRPEDSHSMFCHLLTLVSTLIHVAKQAPGMWNFPLMFLSKFEGRFLTMLRMNNSDATDDARNYEIGSQFQNQAYLEELSLILAYLSTASQDSEVWINKNKNQFNKFFWTLSTQTIRIFSHTIADPNLHGSRLSLVTVSDRFQPVTKFEQQLQAIILKSGGQFLQNKPTSSIMKSTYDPKASLNSELHQFREMKAAYMTHLGSSSNLFAFKLENLISESIFSLCGSLSNMMGLVNFTELTFDMGDKYFNSFFFKDFNQSLTSIQVFAYYAYSKLTSRPETYKDGCVHLQVLADSTEARYQTKGVSSLSCIFALTEMKNMVRKQFEMTYFLQNLSFQIFDSLDMIEKFRVAEELRKQKEKSWIMLQEFESNLLRRENLATTMATTRENQRPYSPMVTPYKSVAKFTPKNIGHDIAVLDEETAKNLFVNMKSIEEHVKFLEFIKNYYPNK